jgi:hypothetical protein
MVRAVVVVIEDMIQRKTLEGLKGLKLRFKEECWTPSRRRN